MAFDGDHWADAVFTRIKILSAATTMGAVGMGCCQEGVRDTKAEADASSDQDSFDGRRKDVHG